jgi:hypothetical protein
MVTSIPTIKRLMQHMPRIRLGRLDPGARPDSVAALVPADVLVGAFAFGNMPPAYRCAPNRGNFKKLITLCFDQQTTDR